VDPRDEFRDYFRWYFNETDVSQDREGLKDEMAVVLPDRYDEQVNELAESHDIEDFIRQLGLTADERGQDDEMNGEPAESKPFPVCFDNLLIVPSEEQTLNVYSGADAFKEYMAQNSNFLS
jgi:hypothetical protein